MSKPPRPSLSSLSDRLAPKSAAAATRPAAVDEAEARQEQDTAPSPRAPAAEGPRDYKTMMCRVNRAGWQEMSRLAIDRDRNLEDLIIEACNDLLVREGFSPVIEKRSPARR
ncbi:hypothetical protein MKK63_24620 [Methylobacterium sp. J-088]|uniref:hypothetical protein n=1 Tax=Methylobacterium sp. J-088 TaxID=2836664 RepID=UPI001FB9BA75|nr:hypothetical protein [Methylobacterium sp. J-088]MCJ2065865.1 hypothetical protein [Methylobacterium sp. J-088]